MLDREVIELRARLAAIVDSSQDAILAKDLTGTVTAWNPAAERLYGYAAHEIVGRSVDTIIPPDLVGESEGILSEVVAGRAVPPHDTERITKAGVRIAVSVAVSPIRDPSRVVIGASTIARDISERLAAETAQASIQEAAVRETHLKQELEQSRRLESVGQLAGGVAHDFNNILAVILNLARFVIDELPEGSSARADAQEIEQAANRAASMTRQLLIFSRRDLVAPEVFDPRELIMGLESFLRRTLGENMLLEVAADDALWLVNMDRGQLEQIVVNLAINGRDAMPSGGRLIVEAKNTVVDFEFASSRVGLAPGNYVTLTVSDTGTGMDPEVLERAFEPFFTTKPEGQGTGLGLATVYGIVKSVGGRVAIYSELDRGTTVSVHLPALPNAAVPEAAVATPAKQGSGEHILVVEDAPDVRNIAERILTNRGYRVTVATCAAEALTFVQGGAVVDLVLTDVVMPGGTGPELVKQLRGGTPSLKVVFMSGYSHKLLTDEVLGHAASAFIEKPFAAAELCDKVRSLLDDGGVNGA